MSPKLAPNVGALGEMMGVSRDMLYRYQEAVNDVVLMPFLIVTAECFAI